MRTGVADARARFRELLDRVERGETVEVTRRGRVVAVLRRPDADLPDRPGLGEAIDAWRRDWNVAAWPDDDPFAGVRDPSPGRTAPR